MEATCEFCEGLGRIFICSNWDYSEGQCCPAGAVSSFCLGKSQICIVCGGKGIVQKTKSAPKELRL